MTATLARLLAAAKQRGATTFSALRYRNYRLWFLGQTISLMGTWMQSVAQQVVVYLLTDHSKIALGTISFAGSIPTLFLMLPAGALADRFNKRRILLATQSAMMLFALVLAALVATGVVQFWHIVLLATALGIANSFDAPTRQALAVELVEDRRDLMNAIALNSMMLNLARIVGPAAAGLILAFLHPAWCFVLNGVSFLAVILALLRMRMPEGRPPLQAEPLTVQLRAGLKYIGGHTVVRTIIALVAVSSIFGFSYSVLLPAFAIDLLHIGESGVGLLQTAVGIGAVGGALGVASLGRSRRKGLLLAAGSLLFPAAVLGLAFSPYLSLALLSLALAGFGFVTQNSTSNTLIQTIVPDQLRGRVMGVYMMMFFGTTPLMSLLAGGLAQWLGPSWATAFGALVSLAFALGVQVAVPDLRQEETAPPPPSPTPATGEPAAASPPRFSGKTLPQPARTGCCKVRRKTLP
ncbi:MAG: MFS transporter [Chloroflexia bacterium]